jgi:hypothetical protein
VWRQRSKSIQIDSDGVLDCDDECPKDSNKLLPVRVAAEKQVDTNPQDPAKTLAGKMRL